jgi:HEAT repeat protein
LVIAFSTASIARADEGDLDSRMYHDPELPFSKVVWVYPDNLLPLWLEALERPEADYQCRGALAIVLAHQVGIKGLEAAIDPLLASLARLDQAERPTSNGSASQSEIGTGSSPKTLVRLALARALIELDARQAAPQLFEQTQSRERRLCDLIEPALARWEFRPAGPVWLERLGRSDTSAADLQLAIRGLAALRELKAGPPLKNLVHSALTSWPMRLEAARALGTIQSSGLESDANAILSEVGATRVSGRLAVAELQRHHQGDDAVRLLQKLAGDSEPVVAVIALDRLLEIDSKLILGLIETTLASPDAKVRSIGVETLFRNPTNDRIRLLADKLGDDHPAVRVKARHLLHDLGNKSQFRDAVIKEASGVLAGQKWQGLEQAAILLVELDHKPAANRLVELLKFERPEVLVTAGWGLRRLDVPETLPTALKHLRGVSELKESNAKSANPMKLQTGALDHQLSHLAQFMGQRRYQAAELTLRAFVPRTTSGPAFGQETRAGSIWALGMILDGKPEAGLIQQLEQRLNDVPRMMDPGEDPRVRRMSAVTLGRMKAKDSLKSLRKYYIAKPSLDPVTLSCGWAIMQNTGEPLAKPETVQFQAGIFKNWLRPIPETKPKG